VELARLRPWEWLAGVAGTALVGSLFLDWYSVVTILSLPAPDGGLSAWEAFAVTDVLLLLSGLFGVAIFLTMATQAAAAVPIATASLATVSALVALVAVAIRTINPPGSGLDRSAGLWIGLAAALALVASGAAAMRDERSPASAPVEPRQVPAPSPSAPTASAPTASAPASPREAGS
jgi:hypothetical protein